MTKELKKVSLHAAVQLTTTPKRVLYENAHRVGLKTQNNETGAAKIFYRSGGTGHEKSFLCLIPGAGLIDDLHAPQQDLWAYSDTDGAVLTIVEDFERGV